MSGKAYTMQEMRGIVEYITERKAFNEIKGRKMWMDFAGSKMTTRTWQSLKETFLKRILPDIHNPYYKLTLHQIASFREGHDVEERLKNKLEVREANEKTVTNGNTEDDKNVTESKPTEEEDKGEDHHISKVDRDSTETLVLNNCYESAEEIKRDLTSPIEENKDIPTKKIRDMLEFEPMTPAAADVQKLIDDFGTEDEGSDGEPKMEIDLGKNDKNCADMNEVPITLSDSDSPTTEPNDKVDSTLQKSPSKNENLEMTKDTTSVTSEKSEAENNLTDISNKETPKNDVNVGTSEAVFNNSEVIPSSTHSTLPDSILPNNQEELNKDSELNIDKELNKPKPLSLKKNGVDSKVNKSLRKRINRISSTTSDENKHEAKKSKTVSADEKETDTKQTVVDTSINNEVIDEENKNNQKDILKEKESISQISENPCLKSVSLYDVQMSNKKNKSSGDDLKSKNQNKEPNASKNALNNIVILKSHSESSTTNSESYERRSPIRPAITKRYRDKALSNVFGFTSGAVRQRKSSYRNRKPSTSHQQTYEVSSDSSEWTSDTASEFVSPPRGRRNKQSKKYLKPKSARITSLEKNGGLFVVYNNKIYPLVKDSKIVKNHVNYISDDESDEASRRWKMKYLEEKKKSAELQRLLNMVQEQKQIEARRIPEAKFMAQCSSLKNNHNVCVNLDNRELQKQGVQDEKPVKIKFTKNNEEVQLEGPLSHITPALAQVIELLNKVPQQGPIEAGHQQGPTKRGHLQGPMKGRHLQGPTKGGHLQGPTKGGHLQGPAEMATDKEESRPPSSLIAINLCDDVEEKIDKLENEIFKEIEEKDKMENTNDVQGNVTKSNTSRRKASETSTNVTPSSPKKRREQQKYAHEENPQKDTQKENALNESAQKENSHKKKPQKENAQERHQETAGAEAEPAGRTTRTKRTSRNTDNEVDKNENNKMTRRSLTKKNANKVQGTTEDDSEIKYKFPSPIREEHTNKTKKSQKNMNSTRNQTLVSPRSLSYSSESMQGYQDSDISPAAICMKKRRANFSSVQRSRSQNRHSRSKSISIPELALDYESSNSFQNPLQTITFQNSSLSTEVYRSDSYQLLMPINVKTVRNSSMIPITENKENYNTNSKLPIQNKENKITSNTDIQEHDGLSSSNVSLPTSPVLSIVENLSISRSLLTSIDDIPLDDNRKLETFPNNQITLNDLMKSDPDLPMPLMERMEIDADHDDGINYHYNINIHNTLTPNSQFLVNKLGTVNIEDQTLSESVNAKLKNLILDSNKKSRSKVNKAKNIESNDKDKLTQKGKTKKRSSTPRRRQTARMKRNSEPSIEEEHMETCSISRKSCPPVIQTNHLELTCNMNTDKIEAKNKTIKEKKKKDIIKVKIIKPKDKANTRNNRKSNESLKQMVINASSELHEPDNSIDLIHNHSETCLQAHECIADSVEIIEHSHSIISIDSERSSKSCNVRLLNVDEKLAQELYSSDARDGTGGYEEQSIMFPMTVDRPTDYHTPLAPLSSANSLLTEDLSIEIPELEYKDKTPPRCTSQWYLFSKDENTNNIDINQNLIKDVGYGSNLNELFPITCAVPDLSTITEMSKENDVDTRSNLESPTHTI